MRIPSGGRPVSEIDEFDLIESIRRTLIPHRTERLTLGIGDDAAVWKPRPGHEVVVTNDMLIENVDFRMQWVDFRDLGHKALAVNLSDIAAMGALPRVAIVSLGLRGDERDREVIEFYQGLNGLARQFRTVIAGGDISDSPLGVVISVTVLGEASSAGKPLMVRSAAKAGDVVAVTGPLGMAAAGLRIYQHDLRDIDGAPAMRTHFDRPTPRVREGRLLARCGVRAAIDISDGLLGDLPKICESSGVSALIEATKIPIPSSIRWSFTDWFDVATRGGEDFELLFTANPTVFHRVCRAFRRAGFNAPYRIGEVQPAGPDGSEIKLRQQNGKIELVEPGAFVHFGPKS
ncbi:MAG: thiamine-phosphate kinase [Nitrolancea sp.]